MWIQIPCKIIISNFICMYLNTQIKIPGSNFTDIIFRWNTINKELSDIGYNINKNTVFDLWFFEDVSFCCVAQKKFFELHQMMCEGKKIYTAYKIKHEHQKLWIMQPNILYSMVILTSHLQFVSGVSFDECARFDTFYQSVARLLSGIWNWIYYCNMCKMNLYAWKE